MNTIFDYPNDWMEYTKCCKVFGIDLHSVLKTLCKSSLAANRFDYFSVQALDLAYRDVANIPQRKTVQKTNILLKDHFASRRELEALGVIDEVVRKINEHYESHFNHMVHEINEELLMQFVKEYFILRAKEFDTSDMDKSLSIRETMNIIPRMYMFRNIPLDERKLKVFTKYFAEVAEILLTSISMHCSEDFDLLKEYIKTFCAHSYYKRIFLTSLKDLYLVEFLMHHTNSQRLDLKDFYKNPCGGDPIETFIGMRRFDLVKIMLLYGYQHSINKLIYLRFIKRKHEITDEGWATLRVMLHNTRSQASYPLLLLFSVYRDDKRTQEDVQLLRVLFRNISNPYMSPHLLLGFLQRTVSPRYIGKCIEACCEYKDSNVCDEPNDDYGPRSLRHLCRITIRERLRQNHQLPSGVESLGLPKSLQNYLNLFN